MMPEELAELALLLREEARAPDEAFVNDVEWLLDLDLAFERWRAASLRRWAVDLGSALAIGGVALALAGSGAVAPEGVSLAWAPLLAATAVPFLWLLARSSPASG